MAHLFEKIDAQLDVMRRRGVTPAGLCLCRQDLERMVEGQDGGGERDHLA